MKRAIPVFGSIAALLGLYLACYFMSVRIPTTRWAPFSGGRWFETPDYAAVPPSAQLAAHYFFSPAYLVDSQLLRPSRWSGPPLPPVLQPPQCNAAQFSVVKR
jgi:hypothetical protein